MKRIQTKTEISLSDQSVSIAAEVVTVSLRPVAAVTLLPVKFLFK